MGTILTTPGTSEEFSQLWAGGEANEQRTAYEHVHVQTGKEAEGREDYEPNGTTATPVLCCRIL